MGFDASSSSIVHGFQAFYYELLRQKEKALSLYFSYDSDNSEDSDAKSSDLKMKNIECGVVDIQKKMLTVIVNISDSMLVKSMGMNPKFIEDAKYLMAILTDEVFLNLKWDGVKFWRYTLLEKQLFQTEIAGDKFFSMLDSIINDLGNAEMSFLYLMVLSLGFKGKYRDLGYSDSDEKISWYKGRLCAILNTGSSRLFFPGRSHMIESCYDYTFMENDNNHLPDVKFWSFCVISVIFLYILISYFVWIDITSELNEIMRKISEQVRQGPLI